MAAGSVGLAVFAACVAASNHFLQGEWGWAAGVVGPLAAYFCTLAVARPLGLGRAVSPTFGRVGRRGPAGTAAVPDVPSGVLAVFPVLALLFAATAPLPPADWAGIAASAFCVALAEETVFRGLLLDSLRTGRPRGDFWAVIVASGLFGVGHYVSQTANGHGRPEVVAQALGAIDLGLILSAVKVYSGTIWLGIGVHSAVNAGFLATHPAGAITGDRLARGVEALARAGTDGASSLAAMATLLPVAALLVAGAAFVWLVRVATDRAVRTGHAAEDLGLLVNPVERGEHHRRIGSRSSARSADTKAKRRGKA